MSKNLCRLCFEPKKRSIGIFTARGVKLKIAAIIQKHFDEEIDKHDIFPKFVCTYCWIKLDEFHTFFSTVAVAKSKFISTTHSVDSEVPTFTEIFCDGIPIDSDSDSMKEENEVAAFVEDIKVMVNESPAIKIEDETDNGHDEEIEHETKAEKADADYSGPEYFSVFDIKMDSDDSDAEEDFFDFDLSWDIKTRNSDRNAVPNQPKSNSLTARQKCIKETDELMEKYMKTSCAMCEYVLMNLSAARDHYANVHNSKDVNVICCDRKFQVSKIRDHLRYHIDPDVYKCKTCFKRFLLKYELKSHKRKHMQKSLECDICTKKFQTVDIIREHMVNVHIKQQQQFTCTVCQKGFDRKGGLIQHTRNVHERTNRVVCHICAKVVYSKVSLRRHMLVHNPQPRVICEICGKSSKSQMNLDKHIKLHSETSVACPHCHKISPNRKALHSHISVVHKKPTLSCNMCDKKCKTGTALKEHIATHTGEDLYSCKYCGQRFRFHSTLSLHYKGDHTAEWQKDRRSRGELIAPTTKPTTQEPEQ